MRNHNTLPLVPNMSRSDQDTPSVQHLHTCKVVNLDRKQQYCQPPPKYRKLFFARPKRGDIVVLGGLHCRIPLVIYDMLMM